MKRVMSAILALVVLVSSVPMTALASESDNLCEHHSAHTEACGYAPAVEVRDCGHGCTEACQQPIVKCVHECGSECWKADPNGGDPILECVHMECTVYSGCVAADFVCVHECGSECWKTEVEGAEPVWECVHTQCTIESGCVTVKKACNHKHGDSCGYQEGREESSCTYDCQECKQEESIVTLCDHEQDAESCSLCDLEALIDTLPAYEAMGQLEGDDYAAAITAVGQAQQDYYALTEEQQVQVDNRDKLLAILNGPEDQPDAVAEGDTTIVASGDCSAPKEADELVNPNNVTWELDSEGTLTIAGTGKMMDYVASEVESECVWAPWRMHFPDMGLVVVENVIIGEGITHIGNLAFYGLTGLKTVVIEDAGYDFTIGNRAFESCTKLESINLDYGVTSIGDDAFEWCTSLSSITIPNSVGYVGESAFGQCDSLTELNILNYGGTIGYGAFAFLDSLESVALPGTVIDYGSDVFAYCTALKTVTINDGVSSISDYMFKNCTSLTSITFPASILELGESVLEGCASLTEVSFLGRRPEFSTGTFYGTTITAYYPATDTTWAESSEAGNQYRGNVTWLPMSEDAIIDSGSCGLGSNRDAVKWTLDSFGTLTVSGTGPMAEWGEPNSWPWYIRREAILEVVVESGVTTVGSGAFGSCTSLTKISLADTVTQISKNAFTNCSKLAVIDFSANLESIGDGAFRLDYGSGNQITKLELPEKLESVGARYFSGWKTLQTISLPEELTIIGSYAFSGCEELDPISLPGNLTQIDSGAFYNCTSLENITLPAGITVLSANIFENCTSLKNVDFDSKITAIGDSAFSGCSSLNISIPQTVEKLGKAAFKNCTSLTSAVIRDCFTSIPEELFSGCSGLETIELPEGVTTFEADAFSFCSSWDPVFPESLRKIGAGALSGCWKNGDEVVLPDSIQIIETGAFAYSNFSSITLPDGITEISDSLFYFCRDLEEVILPDNIQRIGNYAFHASTLTEFAIPTTVTEIGDNAFSYSSLKTIVIPKNVTEFGVEVFKECSRLTSVTVFCNLSTLPEYTFLSCRNLETVELADGIKEIGNSAFYYNDKLKNIHLPSSLTTIGAEAFSNCMRLETVELPNSVTTIGEGAFENAGMNSIILPDGLKEIPVDMLKDCLGITTLTIPASVTKVGANAFYDCGNMTEVTFLGNAPTITEDAFTYVTATVYYPADNATWAQVIEKQYGGTLEWVPYDGLPSEPSTLLSKTQINLGWEKDNQDTAEVTCDGSYTYAVAYDVPEDVKISGFNYEWLEVAQDGNSLTFKPNRANYSHAARTAYVTVTSSDQNGTVTITQAACGEAAPVLTIKRAGTVLADGDTASMSFALPQTSISVDYTSTNVRKVNAELWNLDTNTSIQEIQKYDASGVLELSLDGCGAGNYSIRISASNSDIDNDYYKQKAFVDADGDGFFTWYFTLGDSDILGQGECGEQGDNLTWKLDNKGVLTISGNGNMAAYLEGTVPWAEHTAKIKSLVVKSGVTSLGNFAMSGCTALTSISLPASLTRLGYYAFLGCTGLKMVTVPATVTQINPNVFESCTALTNVTLTDGLETIGEGMFNGCTGLKNLTVPASVTTVGNYAFRMCYGMTDITFEGNAPTFGANSFDGTVTNVWYTGTDSTWEPVVGNNYGEGTLTWKVIGEDIEQPENEFVSATVIHRGKEYDLLDGDWLELCVNTNETVTFQITPGYNEMYNNVVDIALGQNGKQILHNSTGEFRDITIGDYFVSEEPVYLELLDIDGSVIERKEFLLRLVENFTVTFILAKGLTDPATNKDSVYYETVYIPGEDIIPPQDPERQGYLFQGWFASATGSGIGFFDELNQSARLQTYGNTTLFGNWDENPGSIIMGVDNWGFRNTSTDFKASNDAEKKLMTDGDIAALQSLCQGSVSYLNDWWRICTCLSPWGGSCYGMSTATVLIKCGLMNLLPFAPDAKVPYNATLPGTGEFSHLESMINFYHMRQYIDPYWGEDLSHRLMSESDNLEMIVRKMKRLNQPVLLSIRISGGTNGGHAVVAFDFTETETGYSFWVYDCSLKPLNQKYLVNIGVDGDKYYASCPVWESKWATDNKSSQISFQYVLTAEDMLYLPLLTEPGVLSSRKSKGAVNNNTYYLYSRQGNFSISDGSKNATIVAGNVESGTLEITCYGLINNIGDPALYCFGIPAGNSYTVIQQDTGDQFTALEFNHPIDGFFVTQEAAAPGTVIFSSDSTVSSSYSSPTDQTISVIANDMVTSWYNVSVAGTNSGLTVSPTPEIVTVTSTENTTVDITAKSDFNYVCLTNVPIGPQKTEISESEQGDCQVTQNGEVIATTGYGHSVVFDSQLGSAVNSLRNVPAGTLIAEPTAPTRTGYIFGGWYTDEAYTKQWDFTTDTVTTDLVLYAGWYVDPDYVQPIIFHFSSGESETVYIPKGQTIPQEYAPLGESGEPLVWYTNADCTGDPWDFGTRLVEGPTNLYCKESIECKHTGGEATCTEQAVCTECKQPYGEKAPHDYKTEWNQGDENGHWHDCKNCTAHTSPQAHVAGPYATEEEAQVCVICGYELAPKLEHQHKFNTEWTITATHHYYSCFNCDTKKDAGVHTPNNSGICQVCLAPVNTLTGLEAGQVLEIDGKRYVADENGNIVLESTGDKIATSYGTGTSVLKDPLGVDNHSIYPTTMDVWYLKYNQDAGTYTMEKIDALTNFLTYKGTSIRMTGNQGIRIFTAVNEAKRAGLIDGSLLKGTSLAGYKLVECGTLFQFGTLDGAPLVYDASRNNRSIAYGNGTDAIFSRQNGDIWFTGMLVNLKPDLCDDELVLRPYMVLKNTDGKQLVLYGGTLQRNIGYVAYQNKDYKPTQAAADFIWNIIRTVYGDKVTG